jgi:hypothetical protein
MRAFAAAKFRIEASFVRQVGQLVHDRVGPGGDDRLP